MPRLKKFIYICFILSFGSLSANPHTNNLPEIARKTLDYYFEPSKPSSYRQFAQSFKVIPEYKQKLGLFVTLSSKGQTRACWGSINAEYPDLVQAVVYTTINALSKEYRYPPIKQAELTNLQIQITLIYGLEAIPNIRAFNPFTQVLMLRKGSQTAIILPRETTDAHYALIQAKLKAGLKNTEHNYQLYRLKTKLIK